MERTIEELRRGCAAELYRLRKSRGLSKLQIANMLMVDVHTWDRYEKGVSSPDVVDYVYLYTTLHENILGPLLEYLYPDVYKDIGSADIGSQRNAIKHYIDATASPHTIQELMYFLFGKHGSSQMSQIEMVTMYNHLPMEYRYIIAQMIDTFYHMAEKRDELAQTDCVMPNVEVFEEGLRKGMSAAYDGRQSYSVLDRK